MDAMDTYDAFEKRVFDEYFRPGPILVKKVVQESIEFAGDSLDPKEVFDIQMPIAAQRRQVTLALREYHKMLSRVLSEAGITLPDFESLISGSLDHQE